MPFLTTDPSPVLGTRNDFGNYVGFTCTTDNAINVYSIGRWIIAGNTGTHNLALIDAVTGLPIAGASLTIDTTAHAAGDYGYEDFTVPVAIAAGTTFYCVSAEVLAGDLWYEYQVYGTAAAFHAFQAVYFLGTWQLSTAGRSFVPTNFLFG